MRPRRILIIRTDRIGDVMLSTPAIKAAREAYPDSYIGVMVRPYAKDIVEGNPYLDEVIVYDKYGAQKGFLSTLLFALRLRRKNFDTAVILHPTNRAHIIAFIAGIPRRIGFGRRLPFLLTKAVEDKKFLGQKHELEYTLEVLKEIGARPAGRDLYMPVGEREEKSVSLRLAGEGVKASDVLIGVHPDASCPSKRWPMERFASLINTFASDERFRVVLIYGPGDPAAVSELKKRLKGRIIDFSGRTSLRELAALLRRCSVFISNDSGPVHIATAVGTPNVTIFGRKQPGLGPKRWGPVGAGDVVLHKDVGCEICLAHNCENGFKCLKAITVEEVYDKAMRLTEGLHEKTGR